MKRYLMVASIAVLLLVSAVIIAQRFGNFRESLSGYEEVPAVSTVASGEFRAEISRDDSSISYELSYADLEGTVQQSHIHFGQKSVNGGIVVFLCTNLGNGPAGTQLCPTPPATITGTITAANIGAGANAQGIAPGEFAELLRAIRAGQTYANVHSTKWPGGEVRTQIGENGQSEHADHK